MRHPERGRRLVAVATAAALLALVGAATTGAATTTTSTSTSTSAPTTTITTTTTTAAPTTTTTSALPELSVTADRSEGPQGTVVHLSGTGCLFDGPAEWLSAWLSDIASDDADPGYGYGYGVRVVGPPADGAFEIEMTIPPEAFRGEYEIRVWCGVGDVLSGNVRLPFTVTGDQATYAGLAVWPPTVRAGDDIGFGGEHCTDFGEPAASVYVYVGVPPVVAGDTNRVVVPVRADGSWFGLFTIPPGTPQGTYEITAFCSSASATGGASFDLPAALITVDGDALPPGGELPQTG